MLHRADSWPVACPVASVYPRRFGFEADNSAHTQYALRNRKASGACCRPWLRQQRWQCHSHALALTASLTRRPPPAFPCRTLKPRCSIGRSCCVTLTPGPPATGSRQAGARLPPPACLPQPRLPDGTVGPSSGHGLPGEPLRPQRSLPGHLSSLRPHPLACDATPCCPALQRDRAAGKQDMPYWSKFRNLIVRCEQAGGRGSCGPGGGAAAGLRLRAGPTGAPTGGTCPCHQPAPVRPPCGPRLQVGGGGAGAGGDCEYRR